MIEPSVGNPFILAAIAHCGGKQALLAEKLDCAQQTVSKLLHGEIGIDPTWAVRLSRATDGAVSAIEACPELASLAPEPERAA